MTTNGNNKTAITCPGCNQSLSVAMPKVDLFNELRSSAAIAAHEKPIKCACGKAMIPIFSELQITWAILPLTDEQEASMSESVIEVPRLVSVH